MKNDITRFIASKQLSESSKKAYYYDLQQFVEVVSGKITPEKLSLYEHSLADLKVSAKKRKLSAVNQFLYFLYVLYLVVHCVIISMYTAFWALFSLLNSVCFCC